MLLKRALVNRLPGISKVWGSLAFQLSKFSPPQPVILPPLPSCSKVFGAEKSGSQVNQINLTLHYLLCSCNVNLFSASLLFWTVDQVSISYLVQQSNMILVPVLHLWTVFPTSIWLDRIIVVGLSFIQPLMETFLIPRPFKSHSTIPAFSSRNQSRGRAEAIFCFPVILKIKMLLLWLLSFYYFVRCSTYWVLQAHFRVKF